MRKKLIVLLLIFLLTTGTAALQAESNYYIVKAGDSLYKIALAYHISVAQLKSLNQLEGDLIYPGQKLLIYSADDGERGEVYLVKAGDSLYKLALKYNTSIQELKSLNQLNSDMIYIGQELIIPPRVEKNFYSIEGQLSISNQSLSWEDGLLEKQLTQEGEKQFFAAQDLPQYLPGEIIIKFEPLIGSQAVAELEETGELISIQELETPAGIIVNYRLRENEAMAEIIEKYQQLDYVAWVEPNYLYYPTALPSDDYYQAYQWGHVSSNLEAAWDLVKGSREIKVAVLDTGIIPEHPDLKANLLPGADFVGGEKSAAAEYYHISDYDPTDETSLEKGGSHGTHVAGIIGAVGNNNLGVAGVNWQLSLLPIRVLTRDGGSSWDIAEGIYYAIDQGAEVINLSLGSNYYSHLQHEAITAAVEQGITVVAAAGNEKGGSVYYPAAFPETIAVGAIAQDDSLAYYSNFGPEIDLVAPGSSILSTWGYLEEGKLTSSYTWMSGTSMAAPYVSGIVALLLAQGSDDPEEIKEILQKTAVDLGEAGVDSIYGAGLVDAYAALLGKKLEAPKVFAAVREGNSFLTKSELVTASEEGSFRLEQVEEGELYLLAWRDVNANNLIDAGDYFGEKKLNVRANLEQINLQLNYLPQESTANSYKLIRTY